VPDSLFKSDRAFYRQTHIDAPFIALFSPQHGEQFKSQFTDP